jgi:dihydroorotase
MGLSGVPVMAETIALMTMFELVRATGARVHLCRISSAKGLDLIRQAKRDGLPITCDVGVHHIHLIDLDIGFFDPNARLTPPLREDRDRKAIRAALLDGTVDAICSDHTPVDDDAKLLPFGESDPGATGLELLLPLTLKWAREEGCDWMQALSLITHKPAAILNCSAGDLRVGRAADVCVFNPEDDWKVTPAALKSQGKHTPYAGYTLLGRNQFTVVSGSVAYALNA